MGNVVESSIIYIYIYIGIVGYCGVLLRDCIYTLKNTINLE